MKLHDKLSDIQTSLIAKKNQFNAFGKYAYRSTEDILESLKPMLKKHNLVITLTDDMVVLGDRFYARATAVLSYGVEVKTADGWARESLDKKGMDSSQITGGASSYARKYALNGLFAIDDSKDEDTLNEREADTYKGGDYKTVSKATASDKKQYWGEFVEICERQEVDPIEFLTEQVDMEDKPAVHNCIVSWLRSQELLQQQLINFKQNGEV